MNDDNLKNLTHAELQAEMEREGDEPPTEEHLVVCDEAVEGVKLILKRMRQGKMTETERRADEIRLRIWAQSEKQRNK